MSYMQPGYIFCMDKNMDTNANIMDLLDLILSDEQLNEKINSIHSLEMLVILLNLKKKRISRGSCERIVFPLYKIYEKEDEDINVLCEALKMALIVTEKIDEGLLQVITYLNFQFEPINYSISSSNTELKMARLLNEVILTSTAINKKFVLQENLSLPNLEKFLLHIVSQKQNSLRIYVLSIVFPNYLDVLSKLRQMFFFYEIFLQCKTLHNLDILCITINLVDVETLLTNSESVLNSYDFWKYLENCIFSDTYGERKQAIFLLKKIVDIYYHNSAFLNSNISYLQINDISHKENEKIWQHFFMLLDASKEKQLHLIWPSLNLLPSLKYIHEIWQICVYKNLLVHTQNIVVYSVASHIIHENIFLPTLNKYFLSAINKNEYSDYSVKTFNELPIYCSSIKSVNFVLFLEDLLDITWTPTAAWCLFFNMFSKPLDKNIPIAFLESVYKVLKQLPHVYIRNACISLTLKYFIRNYNWKKNFEEMSKLMLVLKDYNLNFFNETILNYIDASCLNIIMYKIGQNDVDEKVLDVLVRTVKILKCGHTLPVLKNIHHLDRKSVVVLYANFFEMYLKDDIEKFILEQLTDLDDSCTEMFLSIVKKLMNSPSFSEIMYQKIFLILNEPKNFEKATVFVSLSILIFSERSDLKKFMTRNLKEYFNSSKTDDNISILFLKLYFLTEKCVHAPFLEDVLNNQSDTVISKMLEYLSRIHFHEMSIDVVHFLKNSINFCSNFVKSRKFKNIVTNYIDCIFSISFLGTLHNLEMADVLVSIIDTFLSLSEAFPIIDCYLSKKIKETVILSKFPGAFLPVLIPAVQNLYLRGAIIKKDERVEYYICQEIYEKTEDQDDNPNMVRISTKMSALEIILKMIDKNPEFADTYTAYLIEEYKTYFGKRYFPDSQIHIQKLRIIQALLTIHSAINTQRQPLIYLIVDSFSTEIHQPCVKQLMQWLLFSLVMDKHDYFEMLKSKINTASKTQPSSIAAFIVVLLHLTLCREETYWYSALEAFIPWSMGPHFKLRVYSQAAIRKLFEEAKKKHYQNFLMKYEYLEKSIISVIEASGHSFYETIKSDELIFSTFVPERDYSLESIYIDIPKLNGVSKTEWENIMQHEFISYEGPEKFNEDRTFSNTVNKTIQDNAKKVINEEDICENIQNIQRKIIPLEDLGVEQENQKHTSNFILIACLVEKSTNLGGLSRTCEVFGVKQLILNSTNILKDKEFRSLSMSSEDWINVREVKITDLKKYIFEIRNAGYSVIGAEQTSQSIPLHKYKFPEKTALVLGNEKTGIPPNIIPILDECIEIPQFGMVRSLNVHVAGATFIWEYTKQHLGQ